LEEKQRVLWYFENGLWHWLLMCQICIVHMIDKKDISICFILWCGKVN